MSFLKPPCLAGLLIALASTAAPVTAQEPEPQPQPQVRQPSAAYAPAVAYPDGGFTWLDHSSTADEGILRGAGAFAEGAGKYNYYTSLGAVNFQEAYRRAIENNLLRTEVYYAKQDLWSDHQERYRRKPLDMEGYEKLAAARSPDRLTAEQYDGETGAIRWPYPLDAAVFAEPRSAVETLLKERSVENSGWGSRNYEMIRRALTAMEEILEAGRKGLDLKRYIHATQFLESVDWEARFAPGSRTRSDVPPPPVEP